jgi:hypothetical protein
MCESPVSFPCVSSVHIFLLCHLLMCIPSRSRSPSALVRFSRSDPASHEGGEGGQRDRESVRVCVGEKNRIREKVSRVRGAHYNCGPYAVALNSAPSYARLGNKGQMRGMRDKGQMRGLREKGQMRGRLHGPDTLHGPGGGQEKEVIRVSGRRVSHPRLPSFLRRVCARGGVAVCALPHV